jgi:hypothetical protein
MNTMLKTNLTTMLVAGCAAVIGSTLAGPAQAGMYRCPVPQADAMVVTNYDDPAQAQQRGCSAIETRHSAFDAPVGASGAAPRPRHRAPVVASARLVPQAAAPQQAKATAESRPAGFWQVDPKLQQARDSDRRRILEDELAIEQQAVGESRARTGSSAAGSAERARAEASLARHLAAIQSLQTEIARLR